MNMSLRKRDPGLQPERTALSWHRTVFSSLVLAVITTRSGFYQAEPILVTLGGTSLAISLMLVVVSLRRQQMLMCDTDLTSYVSIVIKRLICVALGLNALAITLHTLCDLF